MIRRVVLSLNRKTDADILEKLEGQENIQGYIKFLIREDIEKNPVLCLDVPKELHRELTEAAEKEGVSLNQYILYKLAK